MIYLLLLDFAGLGIKSQQGAPSRQLWVHQLQHCLCSKLLAFTLVLAPNLNTVLKLATHTAIQCITIVTTCI